MSIANVLLVDDEVSFIETFSERLELRNFETSTAFSGEEALQVLERNSSIEVVILDVKMPGMDGIETLAEIKRQNPLVEVIMLSGHGETKNIVQSMHLGAAEFINKPF